ncbi:MAG TPA: amidohydrolase [Thermoanaerobaculia bacterium]|nr:amidohydrolase [Thermoanaerobaculia bacterium]
MTGRLLAAAALSLLLSGVVRAGDLPDRIVREIDRLAAEVEPDVITWRRDFHANPELGNRERRTASIVAEHLRRLGLEVTTEVAHTGVVGILRGGRPGPVVALRADMDALPVTEEVDVPFASRVRSTYNGEEVGVMHACGHDAHTAILMGAAEVLAQMRADLPGTVKLIFQPAEEGAPQGERGGAELMLEEGAFDDPTPEAIFGLHVTSRTHTGTLTYRPGGTMASADGLQIVVRGRQTHGAMPWLGVDPITTAGHILVALQSVVGRRIDITQSPIVVSIGSIHGGVRGNIIPDDVRMVGTIRSLDPTIREELHARIRETVTKVAESMGAKADVTIELGAPVTFNDPALTQRMVPTLQRVAGADHVAVGPPTTGAEDFSEFQQHVPGLYFFMGVTPLDRPLEQAAPNHSPFFFVDESGLRLGVRAMANLAWDYLAGEPTAE